MQAPSVVGWTTKERLLIFWQHKKPLVICFISVILIGLGILGLFAFAQVKTVYAKFTGDTPQDTTSVVNVYNIVDPNANPVTPGSTVAGTTNNAVESSVKPNSVNTATTSTKSPINSPTSSISTTSPTNTTTSGTPSSTITPHTSTTSPSTTTTSTKASSTETKKHHNRINFKNHNLNLQIAHKIEAHQNQQKESQISRQFQLRKHQN